jgi:hypothetical protein
VYVFTPISFHSCAKLGPEQSWHHFKIKNDPITNYFQTQTSVIFSNTSGRDWMQLFDLNARIQQLTWSLIFSEKYSTIQSYLWFWPPLILGGSVISAGTLHDLRRVKVPGNHKYDWIVEYFSEKINDHVNCWILAFKSNNCIQSRPSWRDIPCFKNNFTLLVLPKITRVCVWK